MKRIIYSPLLLTLMMPAMVSLAQNISFRALAPEAITVTKQGSIDLEFDYLVLDSDMTRSIAIDDIDRLAALAIDAPAHYNLTIYVDLTNGNKLILDGTNQDQWIPFTLQFAYANHGYPITETYLTALADAVQLPAGFNSIIFPVNRRACGLPLPPPTPEYFGNDLTDTKQRAFLFFYGSIGSTNAGHKVVAGTYETTIEVTIDFTNHDN